jgi:hypothetical protein
MELEFFVFIGLAVAVFIYVVGAFTMFITGHGWMALAWPYHLTCQILEDRRKI